MKAEYKPNETNYSFSNVSPIIKISHFDDDDNHIRTDVFPVTHFLDKSSKEIKSIKYC
tara:strand:+ start:106 stop:279 length:174 start_codon:yes stop_codon:yes gene_type:complete